MKYFVVEIKQTKSKWILEKNKRIKIKEKNSFFFGIF